MLVAVDNNGNRIIPTKGKVGFCQLCLNEVKAYCGEININHWRHRNLNLCDTWKESESEWHRQWKNEFPKEWQEVIIENNFEKHIADIKTPNGLVLELQNSSISSTTIKIRENFYGNIIWLINANSFKDNFIITSEVTNQLRYIDNNFKKIKSYDNDDDSYEIEELKISLKNIIKEIENYNYELLNNLKLIEKIETFLNEININVEDYLNLKYYYSTVLTEYENTNKILFKEVLDELNTLHERIKKNKAIIEKINNLKNCISKGYEHYKEINYESINSSYFEKCIMIEKETSTTLFPTILIFKSSFDFEKIVRNKNYTLFINLSEKLNSLKKEIIEYTSKIESYEEQKKNIKQKTTSEIIEYLNQKLMLLKIKNTEIKFNIKILKSSLELKESEIKNVQKTQDEENSKFLLKLEKEHNEDRYRIMKKYKGLYLFYWKHRRKSWNYSEKKIYLDFENHIFEILSESALKKITKKEFIEKVRNGF